MLISLKIVTGGAKIKDAGCIFFIPTAAENVGWGIFFSKFNEKSQYSYRIGTAGHAHAESHDEHGGRLYTYLTHTLQENGSTVAQLTKAAGNNEKGEGETGKKIKGETRKQKGKLNSWRVAVKQKRTFLNILCECRLLITFCGIGQLVSSD